MDEKLEEQEEQCRHEAKGDSFGRRCLMRNQHSNFITWQFGVIRLGIFEIAAKLPVTLINFITLYLVN